MYSPPDIRHGLDLTEDEGMIRDMVREFADNEVAPRAAGIDEEHSFPLETWEQIIELGLPGKEPPLAGSGGAGDAGHRSEEPLVHDLDQEHCKRKPHRDNT